MSGDDDFDPRIVGVGPHPPPWPDDPRLDPRLLAEGDRRNVIDRYRYWREEAIIAELDRRRRPFHVAVENWTRDANIGAIVRTANAMGAAAVHIVGRRRWNRRGAMMTERYQHLHHHEDIAQLLGWALAAELAVVGVDNVEESVLLPQAAIPKRCVLLLGQEGPGLSTTARAACTAVIAIAQRGSTRSINASAAAAIAMYEWTRQHPDADDPA